MTVRMDTQPLLEHLDWVYALAHRLVRDAALADDVAQAACVAALEALPADQSQLRSWLSAVVHNLARRTGRTRSRRQRREQAAAKLEALPSTDELVALTERQRELAGAVLALDEPYRTTILLRYYEGLSAEEIARHSGTPLNTIRTRIQRGHAALRERLDARYGDRSTWCLAFLPLAQRGAELAHLTVPVTLGVVLMSTKVLLLGAGVLVALALYLFITPSHPVLPSTLQVNVGSQTLGGDLQVDGPTPSIDTRMAAELTAKPDAKPVVDPVAQLQTLRGRVVNMDLAPLAGVELSWHQGPLRAAARTDADGRFAVEMPGPDGQVRLTGEQYALLMQVPDLEAGGLLVIATPGVVVHGNVVLESGAPAPRTDVEWTCHQGLEGVNALLLKYGNRFRRYSTQADDQGRFTLPVVPQLPGAELWGRMGGLAGSAALPSSSGEVVRMVVRPVQGVGERVVAGVVRTPDGNALAKANVCIGQDYVSTDSDGYFHLALSHYQPNWALTVSHPDWTPYVDEHMGARLRAPDARQDKLTIVLQAPLPAIEGYVVDAEGRPCANWLVDLVNPTDWGTSSATLEQLASGAGEEQRTGADGAFRLAGLTPRAYRIYALDPMRLVRMESDDVWPGTRDVILRVPQDPTVPVVHVQVLDGTGAPVVNANVQLEVQVGSMASTPMLRTRAVGRTDETGRCTVREVPHSGVRIGATNRRKLRPASVPYDAATMGDQVTIVVVRLQTLQVRVRSKPDYDNLQVLDASGKVLSVELEYPGMTASAQRVPLDGDAFPLMRVGDTAVTLLLRKGEQEVRRVPVPQVSADSTHIDL